LDLSPAKEGGGIGQAGGFAACGSSSSERDKAGTISLLDGGTGLRKADIGSNFGEMKQEQRRKETGVSAERRKKRMQLPECSCCS